MTGSLRIALGEYDIGWHDPAGSVAKAAALIRHAASEGADLVVLPEMCTTGFTNEAARYAEPADGPSAAAIGAVAKAANVHVIAGIATRATEERRENFYNSLLVFAPDGSRVAEYRKQRLFAYAAEHGTYSAGSESRIVEIGGVRIGLFICFDLRFPELFRAIAPDVDCYIGIASWPETRQAHWDTLLRARSIENQAFIVGVNRIGEGGGIEYTGGSAGYGPWGERLREEGDPAMVTIDAHAVADARRKFPFIEDARAKRPSS